MASGGCCPCWRHDAFVEIKRDYTVFHTLFPKPRLLLGTFALWATVCAVAWFLGARELAGNLSLGTLFGYGWSAELTEGSSKAVQATFKSQRAAPLTFWSYQYLLACYAMFAGFWMWFAPHRWNVWSVAGSAVIVFITWIQVQMDCCAWFLCRGGIKANTIRPRNCRRDRQLSGIQALYRKTSNPVWNISIPWHQADQISSDF
jgi:hypothetical protein